MRLDGVTLLAAPTARSKAYIQALVANELYPEHVIILGDANTEGKTQTLVHSHWNDIYLPDLTQSIQASCERAGVAVSHCNVTDVNAPDAIKAIRHTQPRLVIYSGYGGQIVKAEALACAEFLHIHSGWLPEYRGSTTLYYALLNGELPGATALVLDSKIDTGPVLSRRQYPAPPQNINIDQVYDSSIRADLLVRVMKTYAATGELPAKLAQDPDEGRTYYVIHPVLKHLAILALAQGEQS